MICEDIEVFRAQLQEHAVATSPVQDEGWGLVSAITLPGGGRLGV